MITENPNARADRMPTPQHSVPSAQHAETLGDFLGEIARKYGPYPALIMKPSFRSRVTTFRELEEMSLRMARYLQERGVEKGDRVLLWAPNMPEWVELYFACHLIGAVLVPLD